MFCHHCGAQVDGTPPFCPACGQSLASGGPIPSANVPPAPAGDFVPPANAKAQVGRWIGAGWEIIKSDLLMFALATLVFGIIGGAVPFVLQAPLTVGFYIMCINKILTNKLDVADLFKGFNFFVPSLLALIVISLFVFGGILLCIIPGLALAAAYMFTYLLILDRRMEFWPAMQASMAIVKQDWVGFVLLNLAFAGLHILGALACLVGLLVTVPLHYAAVTAAYQELVGFRSNTRI